MGKNAYTTQLMNSLLRTIAVGGLTTVAILAPNAISSLDKPLKYYLKSLDKKQRRQEMMRLLRYGRQQGLVSESYQHGLSLTEKATKRLQGLDIETVTIHSPKRWDGLWRIIFYDIPETKKTGRDALSLKLRSLGFYQLQRSVWVHPFPCHDEILFIASSYGVESYVTIIEAKTIQNIQRLEAIFSDLI